MSGRVPRLRALRPRGQQQQRQQMRSQVDAESQRTGGNLKEEVRQGEEEEVDTMRRLGNANAATEATVTTTTTTTTTTAAEEVTLGAVNDLFGKFDLKSDLGDVERSPEESAGAQNYECKSCKPPKALPNVKAYLDHLKKEHKQRGKLACDATVNRCPVCSYVALSLKDLETHQRVQHLKRRFFRCAKCSYVTHVRARYTKHVKYHSMPMIKCDACDFRTPYKWNLDRHTRNHGGGGAFQCRACNFTADIRQSLTVHETNHHEPPVGQGSRKTSTPFERKPRNSPKRYNQVGASDFREANVVPGCDMGSSMSTLDPFLSDQMNSNEDKRSVIAGAECIALKCEEKGCQFITAWDSEMQRHLAECHAPMSTPNKSRKPLPMLIPLSPISSMKHNNVTSAGSSTTLLKVPRVRVRPELAQIARDTELAKLYGSKEMANSRKDVSSALDLFEKKNASFFDKLKEKLTSSSSTTIDNEIPEVAVTRVNDLKCWCTFKANTMEELACHKQTHHTALSVSVGTTRCPKCRRRCKSTTDLQVHMQYCRSATSSSSSSEVSAEDSLQKVIDFRMNSYRGEYAFPSQSLDWDLNLGGFNSSGSSVEGPATHPGGRRVFKCPHCPFWASTASRFHVHIVGHLNRKPFECSLCAYRSNWRWDITKHIKLKAAKDPVHMTARVLMTDETGRRNYSKYNKYLAQVEHDQSWDDQSLEERSVEEANNEEPPTKLLIMSNKECLQTFELNSSPVSLLSSPEGNHSGNALNVSLRPPPPLKAAIRSSKGQSLLKNNSVSVHLQTKVAASTTSSSSMTTTTTVTAMASMTTTTTTLDENKRTLWKCKRCNYRDSSRETVVMHVKSFHEATERRSSEEGSIDVFACGDCPFLASEATALTLHRMHHRPNPEAIFKCYHCPYYVSKKAELLDHMRLHGEEPNHGHHRGMDYQLSLSKCKIQNEDDGNDNSKEDTVAVERIIHLSSPGNSDTPTVPKGTAISLQSNARSSPPASSLQPPPPLLLDTRALPEAPLVWVSRPDGTLSKMLKCRHCPYVSARRAEVKDHESMHVDSPPGHGPSIACTDCSFTCNRREVMIAHSDMHSGSLGTVHCLVDETRPDAQQLTDLATLLGLSRPPVLGSEPDLRDSRLVHCCSKCPARFLCEKELRIHLRYHSTELAYSCQWCSYAARQPAHLLAHQKAHSTEYQERTKYLLSLYGHSQRYPPPTTACVEANGSQDRCENSASVAWIVVEVNENSHLNNSISSSVNHRVGSQVFTCDKCPARYFKLDALEYHMTLHGSNNRFKCAECDYSSKTAQNLVKHQVVHRRHNETSLEHAGTSLGNIGTTLIVGTSSGHLIPSQSLPPPPPDPQFGVFMRGNPNFVYPGYLRNGRLKEKRYKCHKCPSAFEKREQYRVHLTLHGAKQRYRCDTCDYSVKYYANYIQHLKKHQANAEAQAVRRQYEDDTVSIPDNESNYVDAASTILGSRSGKTLKSATIPQMVGSPSAVSTGSFSITDTGSSTQPTNCAGMQPSNQDKQSLMLMQKKGLLSANNEQEAETIRCQNCPFSTCDKDAMDAHKRRHGIERMTPSCPHCDYIPRKDENVGEHIRLHFTRLYKPESYLIVELLTLTMRKVPPNEAEEKLRGEETLLFREGPDGRFFPLTDVHSLSLSVNATNSVNGIQEKVIVDPNTGETKHRLVA